MLYIPRIGNNLKILADNEVKDFIVKQTILDLE